MAVRGPPGGVGEEGRLMLEPLAAAGPLAGEEGREDCREKKANVSMSNQVISKYHPLPQRAGQPVAKRIMRSVL